MSTPSTPPGTHTIEADLKQRLVAAVKARDRRTADVIKMINTRVMERRTAKGFSGQVDDDLHRDVIAAYQKSMAKALTEFEAAGERGAEQADQLRFEIAFCAEFLPRGMTDDEVREAVRAAIAELGASDVKQAGRVVGAVMKQLKGRVEAATVKRIAEAELS